MTMQFLAFFSLFFAAISGVLGDAEHGYEVHLGVYPEREVKVAKTEPSAFPDIDCSGMHYEYMQHRNVNVEKFRSRWNFHADNVAGCAQACNQVINFDCKTFLFKHFVTGSTNGTCMLSANSESELEPVKICFGPLCRNDLYNRVGCVPIACNAGQCPDIPSTFCGEGEEINHHTRDKDSCCPLFAECVCKSEKCQPMGEKPEGDGVISFSKTQGCCPKWQVVCNTSACSSEEDLGKATCNEPGQVSIVANGHCCKEAKCICESSSCPLPAQCKEHEQLVVSRGKCCNITLCKPPSRARSGDTVPVPVPMNHMNGTEIYPQCGRDNEYGHIDPVWCEVLLRVDESERHASLLFGLVTAFVILVFIAACCAVAIMAVTLVKVGKNKLA